MSSRLELPTAGAACETPQDAESARKRGVLLINLGTPDRPDVPAVRRYLREFLSDPAVIRLPRGMGWLNRPLGRWIAQFRAPRSAAMYSKIWGETESPLLTITQDQATSLEELLPRGWRVFYAMRYGRPGILETLRRIDASDIEELVVVPMYPQYSDPTTGTALRLVYKYLKTENPRVHVTTRNTWFDDQGYISAQAKLLQEYAASHGLNPDNTYLLFSTHGLPTSYVKAGDPYPQHIARTVGLVASRLGWPEDRMSLAFQSRFGPVEWMQPYTDEVLTELSESGEKRVLICPISFTVDCLETLEEIDIQYRTLVEKAGSELFLCPALNTYGPFMSALKTLVLRGPRPMRGQVPKVRTTESSSGDPTPGDDLDALVMVGASLKGRLNGSAGPNLAYSADTALRRVKRSQCEVPGLLQSIKEQSGIKEAWLWNTCRRFEFFGWVGGDASSKQRKAAVAKIREHLFQDAESAGVNVNVLYGKDAWHHLLRTAAGLNSSLPGERDVLEQMQVAHRLASCAGTSGVWTKRLLDRVVTTERTLRKSTDWKQFDADYAYAALSGLVRDGAIDLASSRIAIVGGSTTSLGVIRMLTERLDVSPRQLTLIYRGHKGGNIKQLRQAIGNGRRVRVQSYGEKGVLDTIAGADLVLFGLDCEEPVLTATDLDGLRDLTERPLRVVDFNVFGSTAGLEKVDGVTLHNAKWLEQRVVAFAEHRCQTEAFRQAVDEAESWIVEQADATGEDSSDKCNGKTNHNTHADRSRRVETRSVTRERSLS